MPNDGLYKEVSPIFLWQQVTEKCCKALDRENVETHVWNMIDWDSDLDTATKKYSI